jgi:hypothetical protein
VYLWVHVWDLLIVMVSSMVVHAPVAGPVFVSHTLVWIRYFKAVAVCLVLGNEYNYYDTVKWSTKSLYLSNVERKRTPNNQLGLLFSYCYKSYLVVDSSINPNTQCRIYSKIVDEFLFLPFTIVFTCVWLDSLIYNHIACDWSPEKPPFDGLLVICKVQFSKCQFLSIDQSRQ